MKVSEKNNRYVFFDGWVVWIFPRVRRLPDIWRLSNFPKPFFAGRESPVEQAREKGRDLLVARNSVTKLSDAAAIIAPIANLHFCMQKVASQKLDIWLELDRAIIALQRLFEAPQFI